MMTSQATIALFVVLFATMESFTTSDDVTTLRPFDYAGPVGIDPSEIRFTRNVDGVCSDEEQLVVVVVVCSAVGNFRRREVIRQAWASRKVPGMHIVFFLGRALPADEKFYDSLVDEEYGQWGDIVQADFDDTYANLTRKSIASLRWVSLYARCARHVLKSDDDSFINTQLLVADLQATTHRKFIMGNVIAAARPVREPDQKWHTPDTAFRPTMYPTYASGAAYVISGDAVDSLLEASKRTPFFWIEDVYVTGMLARAAGVQLIVNGKFDGYRDLIDDCAVRKHIVWHRVTDRLMSKLWTMVVDEQTAVRCNSRNRNVGL